MRRIPGMLRTIENKLRRPTSKEDRLFNLEFALIAHVIRLVDDLPNTSGQANHLAGQLLR
jgi:hypothetical protein